MYDLFIAYRDILYYRWRFVMSYKISLTARPINFSHNLVKVIRLISNVKKIAAGFSQAT